MLKKMITFAAVAGLVLALAPAAHAAVLYNEDWVVVMPHPNQTTGGPYNLAGGFVQEWFWAATGPPNVDWQTAGAQHACAVSNAWGDTAPPPEADNFHFVGYKGDSGTAFLWTSTGKGHVMPTVAAADRIQTKMELYYAATYNGGARFVANVGGNWYVTDPFGTNAADYGMTTNGAVSKWGGPYTSDVENDTWYQWVDPWDGDPTNGYDRDNGTGLIFGLSGPISLPAGDIDEVGVVFQKRNDNNHVFAMDAFVITPEPTTLILIAAGVLPILSGLQRSRRKSPERKARWF